MKIKNITAAIEEFAPLSLQESYDNAGLIIGNPEAETERALITLDVTEGVIAEAVKTGSKLIVAHHPLIFGGLKKINMSNPVERMVTECIRNGIAVYAAHTNLDNVRQGVNAMMADKVGLQNLRILSPVGGMLRKLVVFCPSSHAPRVREALFAAGAGNIGNYDSCSFNLMGEGTFRAGEGSDPFVGNIGELHVEQEERIEVIFPTWLQPTLIRAMLTAHPYEEVAYDIYPLENRYDQAGAGMIGELEIPENTIDFLKRIKQSFGCGSIRHTEPVKEKVSRIAICGGSGSFLTAQAMKSGADVFITGDVKYHAFFEADRKMVIADIGHYESEQFTKELLMNIIKKKFSTFAVQISEVETNPIHYL
ncbi:MAG: Nif3-like dinuclear metal center hexameric protein [Bacteroidales bacterium]